MLQAFAPRLPRGFSRIILATLSLGLGGTVVGQAPPAKPATQPPPAAAKSDDAVDPDKDKDEAPKSERFVDPSAKAALAIFKPLNYTSRSITLNGAGVALVNGAGNALTRLQNMAARVENEDPALVKNYVEFFAAELSKRDNINAILAPPANMPATAPQARGLERAVDALTRPIVDARANNNTGFLTNYTRILFESSLPKLLDNNYLTRLDAMIVLGMAGGTTPVALDLYASQLKLADQCLGVKIWAARGLTNAAQSGKANIDTLRAITAADALVTFLNSDPKLPYFAQFRALEALGSIRVATVSRPDLKLDVASVVAGFLVDPSARVETRAWAAWALGMLRVASQVAPYNFPLAGSEIGDLAATLGTEIVAEYDDHPETFERDKDQATALTALLMFQVVPSLAGEEGISDSGLLRSTHPNAAAARPFLTKLDDKIKAVSREAYELVRAGGVAQKGKRNDLEAKVTELRSFLDQNKPKDRRLVPGGPMVADGR